MIDRCTILCGSVGNDGVPIWQNAAFFSVTSTASFVSDNAIDLSVLRDIGAGSSLFLNVLIKAPVSPQYMMITPEIRGARDASLLDWTIISTGRTESVSSMSSRGFFSMPLEVSSSTYRYLFARFFLELVSPMSLSVFAYVSNVPILESKNYPSGWGIK